jgi:hypothetical protein
LATTSSIDASMAAEGSGLSYAEVQVDEAAAAAIAAATVSPADGALSSDTSVGPIGGRRADRRRTSKRRTSEELSARGAAEDAWIREDLRRIGVISLVLLALLAACWVVFGAMDVLGLY